MENQLKTLQNQFNYTSTTEKQPAHKGNSQIIRNKSGEFVHPIAKVVKRYLHMIK